jgi:hypothetical protein
MSQTELIPLTDENNQALRAGLMTPGRRIKEIALMPLALILFIALANVPVIGLVTLILAGSDSLFGTHLLVTPTMRVVVPVLCVVVAIAVSYFMLRSWLRDYRERLAMSAPLKSDLAGGVKQCETLRIEEALCVQEDEHSGLGYFCRVADGRVILVLDYESASWEDEDLAAGYRRGVDPRQERFVPSDTLRLCRAPVSGFVFDEEFSGERVPLLQGIYWTDVTKLPESGTFIAKSWKAVLVQYKREKRRVDWAEVIKRAEEAVAA